eukprot:8351147-Alexandrium_andersonii.AAC.1
MPVRTTAARAAHHGRSFAKSSGEKGSCNWPGPPLEAATLSKDRGTALAGRRAMREDALASRLGVPR